MSAEGPALEFTDPAGDTLRFEWDAEALATLAADAPPPQPVWWLGGELDWDEVEAARVLSGRLGDGNLFAVVALRPAGASGHGEEIVAGAYGPPEGLDQVAEALISTEYDDDGAVRRLGLELHRDDSPIAIRIAALATQSSRSGSAGAGLRSTALELRSPAGPGAGVLDLLERA